MTLVQFTYIGALYEMHATMCKALRLEFDDIPNVEKVHARLYHEVNDRLSEDDEDRRYQAPPGGSTTPPSTQPPAAPPAPPGIEPVP